MSSMKSRFLVASFLLGAASMIVLVPARAEAGAEAEPTVLELRRALDTAVLGPALPEGTPSYRIGHLEVDLPAGTYALLARGRPVGLFFEGGSFSYRSENRFEERTFPINVERVTKLKVVEGGVKSALDAGLVLDPGIGERLSIPAGRGGEVPESARKAFEKYRSRFAGDRITTTNLLAQSMREGGAARVALAQLDAGRDDLVYLHDGMREGAEYLVAMKPFPPGHPWSSSRYPEPVSFQPLGEPLERWPRRFGLTHLDVELVNRSDRELEMTITEEITAVTPVRTLGLELWNGRITDSGLLPFELESVFSIDGTNLPFSRQGEDLVVELPRTLEPGETLEIRYEISGDSLNRPGGHSFWWLQIGSWFPRPPRMDMSAFTYHAVVKSAEPFIPFSMGKTVRRWKEDGLNCVETRVDRRVQFPVVLAGKYHTYSEERDGFTIDLASYAFSHDESMKKIAHNLFEMKKLYEVLLGEFPFEQLQVIEINSYGFGIAPPGVIYLTREAFDPSPRGRAFREELNLRMAHELAHQYWGHVAQMSGPEEQWLSESTAEYYGAVAVGQFLGDRKFKAAMGNWKEQSTLVKEDIGSIYMANRLAGEAAGRNRYALLYAEGPLMLHELRQELGDETFFTVFKSYLTNFRFQHVETEKLIQITNYITKKDYRPWFEKRLFAQ